MTRRKVSDMEMKDVTNRPLSIKEVESLLDILTRHAMIPSRFPPEFFVNLLSYRKALNELLLLKRQLQPPKQDEVSE